MKIWEGAFLQGMEGREGGQKDKYTFNVGAGSRKDSLQQATRHLTYL